MVELTDVSPETFIFGVQGPASLVILEKACGESLRDIGFNRSRPSPAARPQLRHRLGLRGPGGLGLRGPGGSLHRPYREPHPAGDDLPVRDRPGPRHPWYRGDRDLGPPRNAAAPDPRPGHRAAVQA